MFTLFGTHPLFTPEKEGTQVLWRQPSWPWDRGGDNKVSLNGVPDSTGPWEGWEYYQAAPFGRKRKVSGMVCVSSSVGKRPSASCKYFLVGGFIGYLVASEIGITLGF